MNLVGVLYKLLQQLKAEMKPWGLLEKKAIKKRTLSLDNLSFVPSVTTPQNWSLSLVPQILPTSV